MQQQALQDQFEKLWTECWGCGRHNQQGLQIKSYWQAGEAVCSWAPQPYHAATPGILNGGIIASIIDCHSIWTAIAAAYAAAGRELGSEPAIQYVTGSLKVDYLRPTPMPGPVTLRARVVEQGERKSLVVCSLYAGDQECARGEVLAVRLRAGWNAHS